MAFLGNHFKSKWTAVVLITALAWCARALAGIPGDMNCDNRRNGIDITALLKAMLDPTAYALEHGSCDVYDGDLNADGLIDSGDVEPFVALLMGPFEGPEATTGHIEIAESAWSAGITLTGTYVTHPEHLLKIIITDLPEHGILYQYNPGYQQIPSTPFELAATWVGYSDYAIEVASPTDTIEYVVKSAVDGTMSAPRRVAINRLVSTVPYIKGVEPNTVLEDTPSILKLIIAHEELVPEGDMLTFTMDQTASPTFGAFYQIEADDQTFGSVIASGDTITNAHQLIGLKTANNFWGNSLNFVWKVQDTMGLLYGTRLETMMVLADNDPPYAFSSTDQGSQLAPQMLLNFQYGDIDNGYGGSCGENTISRTFHTLPVNGSLYFNSISPENLIGEPGTVVFDPSLNVEALIYYEKTAPGSGSPFDTFTWSVSDGCAETEIITNTINYVIENVPPVPDPVPTITVEEDSDWIYIPINATDPDNGPGTIKYYVVTVPTHGVLQTQNIIGSAWVTVIPEMFLLPEFGPNHSVRYKPNPGANTFNLPPDSFSFKVADFEDVNPNYQTVSITIAAVNDAPAITGPTNAAARIAPNNQHANAVIHSLSIEDDAGFGPIDVAIFATNANSLFLNAHSGLFNFQQISPSAISFSGTLPAVNAALAAGLEYEPSMVGVGFIDLCVSDRGNTGQEQPPQILAATHQITVTTTLSP